MAAKIQDWFYKNVWDSRKSYAGTYDLKGTAFSEIYWGGDHATDERVTIRRAMQLSTVYTCMNVRAQTIAALPINVIREKNGKKEVLVDHPAYHTLCHEPNNYMSSANLFMTSMLHADGWGNSYVRIHRGYGEDVESFEILQPYDVDPIVASGEAFYRFKGEMIPSRNMLHFRWFSLDGICGISPIMQNANGMGIAMKEERYEAMAVGKKPPGILSYEGNLTPTQQAQNQKSWQTDLEAGRVPVLSGKWTFQPIMLEPGAVQYVQKAQLTDQKIYGIYRIPPIFAQEYGRATFSNAEQSDLVFAKHTITPIVRVIEQECNMKLYTEREKKNTYTKFNMNGLLRGDLNARQSFYTAMRNIGGMNGNEVRALEDMDNYNGGEIYTVQAASIPVDQLREFYTQQVLPSATPKKTQLNGHAHELN